jgi:glyoxylase-like metal-dependent hydrolase (beta-lactamase superfamily II)/rhodanese-related sulfurtransferase
MLIFRQMFDATSSTYTYLVADAETREALLIDPVFGEVGRDAACVEEMGLKLLATLETHTHADHITGAWLMRERLGSQILVPAGGSAKGFDRQLRGGDRVTFGKRFLEVRATPGHTAGCLTYVLDDRSMAFTGDCLLIRGCGRTDFQEGSAAQLFRSVHEQIFSLPDDCLVYPAHDYRGLTASSVGEERRFNPRLGGAAAESDFALYMDNLGLPHPKLMAQAVPANLRCGEPDAGAPAGAPANPDWAPLHLTFAGIWEVAPEWLEEHRGEVQVLDVREPAEFSGPLGRIKGARNLPLGVLAARLVELSKDRPIVAVCRSGARSAQATIMLQKAGFARVANLTGGMLRWRSGRHAVEGGTDYDSGI